MNNATRVVIINFNAGDALQASVASVLSTREPLSLIVADNASTDGSCEKLRSLYTTNQRLEILENPRNFGFARAVNACAMRATEPYLLILNPDCELYPGALAALRQALEGDQQAAMAAPRVVDRQDEVLRGTVRQFPNPWKAVVSASGMSIFGRIFPVFRGVESTAELLPANTERVEAVSGACMLVRTAQFQAVGGFDEQFLMHFEDLDLMYRLRQNGWYSLYVPEARAFHQPGTSSKTRPWWVHRQKHSGMQRYFKKHHMAGRSLLARWVLTSAIWLHYVVTLPLVLIRQ